MSVEKRNERDGVAEQQQRLLRESKVVTEWTNRMPLLRCKIALFNEDTANRSPSPLAVDNTGIISPFLLAVYLSN